MLRCTNHAGVGEISASTIPQRRSRFPSRPLKGPLHAVSALGWMSSAGSLHSEEHHCRKNGRAAAELQRAKLSGRHFTPTCTFYCALHFLLRLALSTATCTCYCHLHLLLCPASYVCYINLLLCVGYINLLEHSKNHSGTSPNTANRLKFLRM
jgi:hypothetical protein